MKLFFLIFIPAFICVSQSVCADEKPTSVEVFYEAKKGKPIEGSMSGVGIKYYEMDKAESLEAELSKALPNDLNQASAYMSKYMNSASGQQKMKAIAESYQNIGRAFKLGVEKLPAIVIDERYVVYGATDIQRAVSEWKIYVLRASK